MRVLAYLDLRKRAEESMIHNHNVFTCEALGLKHGQVHNTYGYKNLRWSFDHDRSYFGQGDLSFEDIDRIYEWLCRPENQNKVFTGWHHKHGTDEQETPYAIVRISYAAGMTRPDSIIREVKVGA
jgi:hypothetical protein